ncbi:MAG: hypothetical protein WBD71_12345 [Xanthobacteraceae bacterium]
MVNADAADDFGRLPAGAELQQSASSWRRPASRTDSRSPNFYRRIGRVLEEGKFHLGFFDDRLSMPDMFGRDHGHTVAHGCDA